MSPLRRPLPAPVACTRGPYLPFLLLAGAVADEPQLGPERVVMTIGSYGEIELGFYPDLAPVTVAHILKLFRLGCYQTNHVFRVDKGFVAQVADVVGGRREPLSPEQRAEAEKKVPGEFQHRVLHTRGVLSMGRFSDPDSGTSSFSMLLGDAPHLDGQYTVFGRVTRGDDVLTRLEGLETHRKGIFLMPMERVEINGTRVVGDQQPLTALDAASAADQAVVTGGGFSVGAKASSGLDHGSSGAAAAFASGAVVASGFADAEADSPTVIVAALLAAAIITLAVVCTRQRQALKGRD